jgi:UDP-3-O-[3-hydroxymyristoyl] N-acetylglucosamine deacetylase
MQSLSIRQCTLAEIVEFSGIGVHSGLPVTLSIEPAPVDSGLQITRSLENGSETAPTKIHFSKILSTNLCTKINLGDSVSAATVEHVVSALSGLGVDNALIRLRGSEFPILDGSAMPFAKAIIGAGLKIQPEKRKYIKILRSVIVRKNDAFAVLEPYNGRALDLEIDFDNKIIGRQRMIFDWTPRKYFEEIALARTFGFTAEAKILQQGGHALGSSLENSIAVEEDRILNPEGLRFEDEFVRHKLLDAIGDLALGGLPIYGKFRSFKGGHELNALVLSSLFANADNYEIVNADELPLAFDALEDLPDGLNVISYLRSVG